MELNQTNSLLTSWLSFTQLQTSVANDLERALQEHHRLSLNEFYVLWFLAQTPEKKLKIHQLQHMVGLSQSAMSRLVNRLEAKSCRVLTRHNCEVDRRAIYTSLTQEGEAKLKKAAATFNETLENAFSNGLLQDQLQTVVNELKK